jgi:hypothetical protein
VDASSLDNLARALAAPFASRRALFAAAAAAVPSAAVTDAKKKHRKRCKKKKRCGKDCCNTSSCFAKTVNGDDSTDILAFGCCPAGSICKSILPNWQDQCCYADETCDPGLPDRDAFADSICCRTCGADCCKLAEQCVNGVCEPLTTARQPRYRR